MQSGSKDFHVLYYDVATDSALCHYCIITKPLPGGHRNKDVFADPTSIGFRRWIDAIQGFERHQAAESHKASLEKFLLEKNAGPSVVSRLCSPKAKVNAANRKYLNLVLETVIVLALETRVLTGDLCRPARKTYITQMFPSHNGDAGKQRQL